MQLAKRSDALLAKLIDKVYRSPQAVKLDSEKKQTIIVPTGGLNLPYLPKTPIIVEGKRASEGPAKLFGVHPNYLHHPIRNMDLKGLLRK